MAQEAVTNAIKHGQAKRIAIRLTQNRRQITLVVTDNGLGLAAGQKQNIGMGLRIMRYRAGLIGGELTIKDNSAGGATVTCTVGLAAAGK
jgi:signal transduction histidine kinase